MSDELVTLKMDASGVMSAIDRMIPQSKQELGVMLRDEVMRPLVRKIISITPPAHGSADMAAKRAGEMLIKSDIGRVMRPASDGYIAALRRDWGGNVWHENFRHGGAGIIGDIYTVILEGTEDISDFHQRRRSKNTGRVGFSGKNKVANWGRLEKRGLLRSNQERAKGLTTGVRKRDLVFMDLGIVPKAQFDRYVAREQGKVGTLAGGWNAAADTLGVARPAWISRHGTQYGQIEIDLESDRMRILIRNAAPFTNSVKDLQSRVQQALDWQARDMNRRVDDWAQKTVQL